ncbi:nebulin isoform X6 [Callorhinchus milii]|uniref:nebulin isoform X6 n=1 Tax=Callorhinchus milii TaxID=7868 RepID=UPI001C3F907E|nr:nebulin isoform X6 [Callorhinchus milii]
MEDDEEEYTEYEEYEVEETVTYHTYEETESRKGNLSKEISEPRTTISKVSEPRTVIKRVSDPSTTTTQTQQVLSETGLPVRQVKKKRKVDTSKFMTPYLAHSQKMQNLFSQNKYKEMYEKERGKSYAHTSDTPELRRIRKVQRQLSDVKYRMEADKTKNISHLDGLSREVAHAKHVSQLVSKVLYKQKWEESKDVYQLPPDAPELVQAVKFAAMFSPKLYKEDWEQDKVFYFPYSDSPELRRVANAQKVLSDIQYKKGHNERKAKYTSLANPPDVELAKKVFNQLSDLKYHEDHKKSNGKWSQTPCYDVAVAKMNSDNLSAKKYQAAYEDMKDQLYFMQTDTPEYRANKNARNAASSVKYRADYEKNKDKTDYNTLPATENPLLQRLKSAGQALSDKLYKSDYEKARGKSINYCDTPKFQLDKVLSNFTDKNYKQNYMDKIRGHYIGSYEDPYMLHCMKVEQMKSNKNYKADYELDKTCCYFPQTVTPEYEAMKHSYQCKDHVYRSHPDTIKFTQVTDTPVMVQAQINAKQLSDLNYKAAYEKGKFKCNVPPDDPFFIQSRVNAYNLSNNCYKDSWEKAKAKHCDIRLDAVPLIAAKAQSIISSNVKYKKDYEKSRGKHVGARSIEDDPKILHSVHVAKMQSEREYKKEYEKTKTKYHSPLDMIQVSHAKKSQDIASNLGYKQQRNRYFLPPDSLSLELAKKAYGLQSDIEYKSEYNQGQKGTGWIPFGSVDVEKAKRGMEILNEKKYRQPPDTIKFTSIDDSPEVVLAKINQQQRSDLKYKEKGEKIIHKYTYPPDLPEFIQARVNAYNSSNNCYKNAWKEDIAKGYHLTYDAIPILAAKAARNHASDVKYKQAYEKARGKHVGFRSLQDDPKLVHSMHVAKMQSEREYKKNYEKSKTKYHTPLDMINITAAKKSQEVASNTNYKQPIHNYTYLPDAMNVELCKNMMNIQSNINYKYDYNNWFKGIGWSPHGSIEVETAKKAGEVLNEHKYRQHPDTIKFTSVPDSMEMVLAKGNSLQLNDKLYRSGGEKVKHKYTFPHDLPQFIQARYNATNISDTCYKDAWQKTLAKGHHVQANAIPIVAAKASRNIASDYKYKQAYEKARGKHVGFRSLQDDPKLVHSMHIAKMQSDREYKKDYEKSKTKYHTPADMVNITAAKQSQDIASNINYKKLIHHYTYLPDAMNLELSRNMMNIQSNNLYKQDYNNWVKGLGWIPIGSVDVEKAKKAGDVLNEHNYRQHPDTIKFTSVPDSMEMVLATSNSKQLSDLNYKKSGEEVKHKYTLNLDYPAFLQAKVNAFNLSENRYKHNWQKSLAKGYDLRSDAITIKAAKASRNIASDYKYKEAYEKARGKHVGFRSLLDDPKLVHSMHIAKMQSDREYKKDYEKSKTKYHTPADMVNITAAKQSQDIASNINYKKLIHHYTILPDAMSLELSRKMMNIQSDNNYKADYNNCLRGIGWIPAGSLDVEKARKSTDIASERKYRQHPDTFPFTSVTDSLELVLAKANADIMNKKLYTGEWEKAKTKVHIMPDAPEFVLSRYNQHNMSEKMYRSGWEESKKKGYNLMPDAISIKAAKKTGDIASNYKYKLAYEKEKGKQIGFRSLQDDPKLVHFMQVAKMQSDREYKKAYEKTKTKYKTPLDMFSITAAKTSQDLVSNIHYKKLIHNYMVLPDSISMKLARNMMNIQSDNLYKSEYNDFMKGIGWFPDGSVDHEKNKKASSLISEKNYRQHPENFKFTIMTDSIPFELAKSNSQIMNAQSYKVAWEKDKTKIHVMPDTPEIILAKANQYNMSQKMYRQSMEDSKKKGYDLRVDAIPIKAAKKSRDIASDYKYKSAYEKDRGKHIGFRSLQDDPKLVHYMNVAKMQSDREYKKNYEKSKTRYHTPVDMLSVIAAKKSQEVNTNINYKQEFRKYTYLPDAVNLELCKHMMAIQSDNKYKTDLEWLKGIGWSPVGSLDVEKAKKATEIISEKNYRQRPDSFKHTTLSDSVEMVLAKANSEAMNKHQYVQDWEKDKIKVHMMMDTPEILQANANKITYSDNLYKQAWLESKKKGYVLTPDAISVKAAKTCQAIASDYKYKTGYRKQVGHHVGCRDIQDDPKMVWSMHVAKIQSDREYKKDFEKSKTKYNMPVDTLDNLLAKKCQTLVSDIDYRHHLHQWTCLPDQNDVILARKAYNLQSDILYKLDMQWLKGIGWNIAGSLDVEKAKKAGEILSEHKYRQHPATLKFTCDPESMDLVLAKSNALILDKKRYTEAWEKDKTKVHVTADAPEIQLAKVNSFNISEKMYKLGYEELKKKGYDLTGDAISIKLAKASRDIASDYKYKTGYRKQVGHHVGCRDIQDDPKMVWSMHVAKIQSDREYKKDFEKSKTKYNIPVDMLDIQLAKKCQTLVSDIDYRHYLHQWTCLPDQNDVIQARKAYNLQSDNLYKLDLEWLKGIGWIPTESLDVAKAKKAGEILSESKYRQRPDIWKFTSVPDSIDLVLAKSNALAMNKKLYTEAWEKDKTQIHVMPDTPEIILAKANTINISDKMYKLGYEELKKKGYDLTVDAISIKLAKASRDIASDYKYKTGYRKQVGHHVGCRDIQDDPKMVWSMHVAKIQSDREYKKDFEKSKTKYNIPVDMLDIQLAKKCQTLVSDIDYRHHLHQWTCLPDQNDVIQARKAYNLQSDNLYKMDLQWLKGIGWAPVGSVDLEKVKKAGDILSESKYRQHPDIWKFTSVTDSLDLVLAKANAQNMNKRAYVKAWEDEKANIHIMPDTPEILLAKQNQIVCSEKQYRLGLEESKKKGYHLRSDAIAIKAAKASRDIASDYKYKTGYRKQVGHHVGCRDIQDDPKMVWSMHVAKIQSDREYKKDFEKSKTKYNIPVDMLDILLAKKCQTLVSDIDYRHYLHQWTCLPDQNDVIQARKAYNLQSDLQYKCDLQWLKGIGWVPHGSLEVEKVKKAGEILSENKYRQHPANFKFSSLMDSIPMTLAKANSHILNQQLYTEAWEKDKLNIHIMPDTPAILLANQNKINFSEKQYRLAMEESKKKGYDLRADAISIKAAKKSNDIASDYKYKTGYRKQVGHHVGCRDIQDDPKMVWSMHVAKIQSDREYKKDFEKSKTKYNIPVDMLDIQLAKKCQTLVSDIDYRHHLHQWTCLPDQNDVIQARKAYDLQSDNLYKLDMQWMKGVGWSIAGSLDVEKARKAGEILSEKKYRQPADSWKFTSDPDSIELVLAKANAQIMNKRAYIEAWEAEKTQIHVMPDTPEILLAKQNQITCSEKQYRLGLEESKKKGYHLRSDAIAIKAAKASRDIASDYKYKTAYRKQLGHHVGCRDIQDDPKMVWSMHVAKIQSDREYKKNFEKSKTKYNIPVDMLDILLAKKCQTLVSDIDYRHYLHQWTCLPDQNDVIQARKAYNLQSDILYKADLDWIRGVGWSPVESLDVLKAKKAGEIISEKCYRQPPDKLKFTSITDSPELVLAKNNAQQLSKYLYTEAWNNDKTSIHVMPDTPEILLAKANSAIISQNLYRKAWEEYKRKGYDLRVDAIPIRAARASRDIASMYKYKAEYEKTRGHHVGCRDIQDDPKMVWSMHVAKIQSDREYKKDFEKSKTKYNIPVDMLDIQLAKKCQTLVSDIDYRHYLHQWTCLPDQNDVIQARKAYNLQSDWLYKSDLEWIRGCGWLPHESIDVKKVKKAQEIISEHHYRQPVDQLKFTSIIDPPSIVLAKTNAEQQSERLYHSAWEKDKTNIHLPKDTPAMLLSKQNSANISLKLYRLGWEEALKKGYNLTPDAISIKAARASRDIASDYKYKTGYRKQLGHHVGCRDIQDDPKMVWSMHVAKIQSDREYKKNFEKSKTKYNIPVDMLDILLAKKCQTLVSDIDYRHYLHQWTCLPDQNDVIQARKAYNLQSDWLYKSDLEWIRGCGWLPHESIDVKKVKKAQEIISEHHYRQPVDQLKFTSIIDPPSIVLAKTNAEQQSNMKYKEAWEKDKTQIHILPDTPEILLAKANSANISEKLYKQGWENVKHGIDMRADSILIRGAKASRDIASDYKYKTAYRKQLGHHVGCRDIQDDPKMVWSMHVAKIQSDREYKKDFEKSKTKYHIPADMLDILLAKKCQSQVSEIDYRHYLHQWTCLPDQNDVIQARKAYDLQSDNLYKADLEWLRGIGWSPTDSIDVKKVKHAQDILSERSYRTRADVHPFTSVTDRVDFVTAKLSGDILNDVKYREAWHNEKGNFTLIDSPNLAMAREAAKNMNNKLYKEAWEKNKTNINVQSDAVAIRHAKLSQGIQSELKYKAAFIKQRGHHVGCRDIQDDPKMVWSMHVAKIQSDREYKKNFEKSKTKYNIPADMLEILLAKKCQSQVSEVDYRHYLHQWTCLPDQNDVIQARKAYDLQSDNLYKSDLEWVRGCGWIPLDSVEHQKVKKAQEILNQKLYKQDAIANFAKLTSITDAPDVVLSRINTYNLSDLRYKETFNLEKGTYIGSADTPQLAHSREMAKVISEKSYKDLWDRSKAIGYSLDQDYLPLVYAKNSKNIASDLKYKELYEKHKGHYMAGGSIKDFPSVVHCLAVDKMRNMLDYKKSYEKSKFKVHIPNDMVSHVLAKKCQQILSDLEYRTYLHQWTCPLDEQDVIHARKAQEILSDVLYKDDLTWLKGIGCYAWDTPEILRAKQAYEQQSEIKYRVSGKKNFENYTVIMDTPGYVTAVHGANVLSDAKYKANYEKTKDKYTTVLETVDYDRTNNLKSLFSSNAYKMLWDKVKATSYSMPSDAFSIALNKKQQIAASPLKYREDYEKFKALYTIPSSVEDDPLTLHCLKVGKLTLDRLYRKNYELNKAKVHIVPDMLEVVAARDTQNKVSEVDYRTYLHQWTCLPDMKINIHARKVNEQLSDIIYKDDLNWLKGIGCNVWDTPEILRCKKSYDQHSDIKYRSKATGMWNQFTSVMDTPTYVDTVVKTKPHSDIVYRNNYITTIKGKVAPTTETIDLTRAREAGKLQSENLYREVGRSLLPSGYKLATDMPIFKHIKNCNAIRSDLKYKEAYEHMKAKGYLLAPDTISFVTAKKADKILNQRLYREKYEKGKDKIHPAPDTPEIRQVKATQEAISDLVYKSKYFDQRGQMISLPFTPELLHHRYVGEITSDNKYKEDLNWLKGIGCFLYETPEMVRVRDFHKFVTGYKKAAKKMEDKFTGVLDTPEYRHVTELKTHLSNLVYRAAGNDQKTKYTPIGDSVDLNRAKHGQKIQSQYLYVALASKERPHYTLQAHTPALEHTRHVKKITSERNYKEQYEKMKCKYTSIPDTPILLRSKKAYANASDLRYKEAFEHAKGHYHTVKDALNITYHRKVTDDISEVKYREKYIRQLGLWRSIADLPEHFHHRMVTDSISDVKYKEDLTWLKGIGCFVWDTPDLVLAEKNSKMYSQNKYKESFEKNRNKFKYTSDTPHFRHVKEAGAILDEKSYKSEAKMIQKQGCNEILRPDMLTAMYNSISGSQWNYKKDYEKKKDKFTSILETPENLRTQKVTKMISDISYKSDYNKNISKGYTAIHDTPLLLHMHKIKDRSSALKYRELYEKNKAHCNITPDAFDIRAAKSAYKNTTNLDYKKKYEATKAKWVWTVDRPDFIQASKASLQQSDVEYKMDREFLKGCKLSVPVYGDKNMTLAVNNSDLASDVKYKLKHEKERGTYKVVPDTPQMLHAKSVATMMSEKKYKEAVKRDLPHGTYTKLPETRDTAHVKQVSKLLSGKVYKEKFEKERGKSTYSNMVKPPEIIHAMNVAKNQSNIQYKKDAKSNLSYSSVADRPDIKKATEATKLISDIGYRTKAREEASRGIISLGRPDIELAKEVSKLTSQIKYKEKFDKEMKEQRPKFDLKESTVYKTMKDANILASEVIYKQDLKKLHKPVTDMSESLQMQHNLATSKLASQYRYKKEFESSKGHYQLVPDTPEQIHLKEATELQSQVKYKEKYEKERGKPMLDFETPVYLTAKESQQMQSGKEYRKDFEESIKGRNLTGLEITPAMLHARYATKIACEKEYRRDLEEGVKGHGLTMVEDTPDLLRAKNATSILNERRYKRSLEEEIKGKGLVALAAETPEFFRAKNATDILSQVKYKSSAEKEKSNYTTVIDTPEIIHAQHMKTMVSQKKYKEEAERSMSHYVPVIDTPEMQRVRENQKNFSALQYTTDLKNIKGKVTAVKDTPEILRAKENQKNFSLIAYKEQIGSGTSIKETPEMERVKRTQEAISSIKYKESVGQGTSIADLPEVKRVKETQRNISSIKYKESVGQGTAISDLPEVKRVKESQKNISSIKYKESVGQGTAISDLPEVKRVKESQKNISSIKYKETVGQGTAMPDLPEMKRVKENQKNISLIKYRENVGQGIAISDLPEVKRVKETQNHISSIKYKDSIGQGTAISDLPEVKRVKETQKNISSVLYKENLGKGTAVIYTPEMQRVKRNQENISSVLYSDSFRKQVQGRAAYVLDTPEMRRVRDSQRIISTVKYHEDFEKTKGSFTPVVTDPITERVKKNMQDFSDLNYRGIQRRVVEMEKRRVEPQEGETLTDLRVWRTNPGSVFDYDPAEDNIQSRSLHLLSMQAQRRSREHSRSASALSLSGGDEKSEGSEPEHVISYGNGTTFFHTTTTYQHAKTTEVQQRSSSVATQQTNVSSIPSHPSTTGRTYRAMYDYAAADADEISFKDGDVVMNVQSIDEGWMYGTVQRTGQTGMLPANYMDAI